MTRPRVGWIGLGRIGAPMAHRVAAAGFPLEVWARDPAQAAPLVAAGASCAHAAEALAARCDVVATIVGGPDDVADLDARLMPRARPGTVFVDLTTASPRNAVAGTAMAARHGVLWLDAPVTGGVAGAQRGALTVFAGGDAAALERARPVLAAFAARIVHAGGPGAGYRMKLVNQTIVAGTLLGLARGAALARAAGFDAAVLRDALSGGTAAGFLAEAYLARMVEQAGPVTFPLALLRKDLALARDEAQALGVDVAFVEAALASVDAARARHGDGAGVHVLAA